MWRKLANWVNYLESLDMNSVAENLNQVQQQLADAVKCAGRAADEVELMAVSKTWPAEHVQLAVDAGQLIFGENKIQEGEVKIPTMSDGLEWHMIGNIQRNKVRKMLSLFHVIHSLDSLKLARYMNNVAEDLNLTVKTYLQVNIGEEPQKSGFHPDQLVESMEELCTLNRLEMMGVMCIPPAASDSEQTRPWFAKTRELRDTLATQSGLKLEGLSMGMSTDYAVAIEEGATIVRVGSSIFGQRNYNKV